MTIIKFDDFKKKWYEIARYTNDNNFTFELEVHKKLLNIFHVGDHYYYIFNCANAEMEYVSQSVRQVLGIDTPEEFTIEYLLTIIHPQDLPYFYDFEDRVTKFFNELPPDKVLKYKVSYDYRMRRKDGSYIRILQQVVTIQSDDNGAVIRVMGVHTDITHLNKPVGSSLSFIGMDGEPSYYNVTESKVAVIPQKSIFTKRERQVLERLMQGKTSAQIAKELFIAKQTVDGHRKNLLKKTDTSSTVELTIKLMQQG
ncbi:LuxR C-terminal-related transcriptional regulator [Mucilaginibacter myungsuensis]|uniref:PAS domain-containing protein n=1 Tax=Mucilaginibacter myungsuensis TaxID=649104 RepID=A0A929KZX8_9SPHI|nr:LuxR C-terminal-related transcriptional regulator [Mucilaginibacter myungsuensis]MBE9663707.1 PAS domain-containing protein [Mucilaginibacter myungsuensis]MDN3598969.1 LuxR C-terminal-related transcriptional regulator [Mucilaginibacter myungsuensis]